MSLLPQNILYSAKLFFACLLLILLPTAVKADQTIRWLIWDFKPDYIVNGEFQGQGYGDKLLARLKGILPEYKHQEQLVNSKRWAVEAQRANTCTPLLWQGFLPGKIVYTRAYGVTAPYVAVVHEDKAHLVKEYLVAEPERGRVGGTISLATLLAKTKLRLGVLPIYMDGEENNARYPLLHPYIKPYLGTDKVKEFGGTKNQLNLRLLDSNRVDYVIENPITAPTTSKLNNERNKYLNFRLTEENAHKKIAVACTNDEFGRKVTDKVNAHITPQFSVEFLEYMEEWNGHDPLFRETVLDYFVKGVETPNVID